LRRHAAVGDDDVGLVLLDGLKQRAEIGAEVGHLDLVILRGRRESCGGGA
jgi:hypothetical protein